MNQSEKPLYNLSKDYEKLYQLICDGHRVAAWADSYSMGDPEGNHCRDICEVRRIGDYEIMISCRGTSYGYVWPFMKNEGPEKSLFVRACRACELEWVDPT